MAKTFVYLVLVFIILSNNVFHITGRNLRVGKDSNSGQGKYVTTFPSPDESGGHKVTPDQEHSNAFWLGSSPGLGHSSEGKSVKVDEENVNAFRSTNPGPSPGIGHSIINGQ
ncbi:Unknown protein [Striga hermonthica]|uniref:Uncharacterized protein n=1 Tax=Striga hermonthica TaxID=68872 RepID=A0A9N7NPA1_STRHE|nr:Unknown protein [Striga hermonthica]